MKRRLLSVGMALVLLTLILSAALPSALAAAVGEFSVPGTTVVKMVAGENHTLALMTDGSLWAWGSNASGQIGDGTTTGRPLPVRIMVDVADIAAGANSSYAIVGTGDDAKLYAWGNNKSGQLGDTTTGNRLRPTRIMLNDFKNELIPNLTNDPVAGGEVRDARPKKIAAGFAHTMCIDTEGRLWAWGSNTYGQHGNGTTKASILPQLVEWPSVDIENATGGQYIGMDYRPDAVCLDVVCGYNFTLVKYAKEMGFYDNRSREWGTLSEVVGMGQNTAGQLGDDSFVSRSYPVSVQLDNPGSVDQMSAGGAFSLFVIGDDLYGCGSNTQGELMPTSTSTHYQTPQMIRSGIQEAHCGYIHSVAVQSNGTVVAWGNNRWGQFGNGVPENAPGEFAFEAAELQPLNSPEFIGAGYNHTFLGTAEDSSGETAEDSDIVTFASGSGAFPYIFGYNGYGQTGDGTYLHRYSPRSLPMKVFYERVSPVSSISLKQRGVSIRIAQSFPDPEDEDAVIWEHIYTGFEWTILPDNALDKTVTWSSTNPMVAKVDANSGYVTGIKAGTTKIYATAYNGRTAYCNIEVKADVDEVTITNIPTKMIEVNKSHRFKAEVKPSSVADATVRWNLVDENGELVETGLNGFSTIENLAQIESATGTLFALGEGSVTVRATSNMNLPGRFSDVTVECGYYASAVKIYRDEDTTTPITETSALFNTKMTEDDEFFTFTLTGVISTDTYDKAVTQNNLNWSSSAPNVALIVPLDETDPGGEEDTLTVKVIVRGVGNTTITAQSADGRSRAIVKLTVRPYATEVNVKQSSPVSLTVGSKTQLTAGVIPTKAEQKVAWKETDEEGEELEDATGFITLYENTGSIRAERPGVTYVKAVATDGSGAESEVIEVRAIVPVTKITLNHTSYTLNYQTQGEPEVQLAVASVQPSNASDADVTWSSSNESVCTVEKVEGEDGEMIGLVKTAGKPGTAKITATTTDGSNRKATCTITVVSDVDGVIIIPDKVTLAVGRSTTLKAQVTPASAPQDVTWTSSDPSVVVDARGKVTAGIRASDPDAPCIITATANDGSDVSGTCEVTVNIPATTVKVNPSTVTLPVEGEATVAFAVTPLGTTDDIEVGTEGKSSNSSVATAKIASFENGNGEIEVTAGGYPGKCTIDFTLGKVTFTARVTVIGVGSGVVITNEANIPDPLYKGKSFKLTASVADAGNTGSVSQAVEWSVDREDYAKIDKKTGVLTVRNKGKVTVTCTSLTYPDLAPATVEVVCEIPVSGIMLSPKSATLIDGLADNESVTVYATISPLTAFYEELELKSSNENVATAELVVGNDNAFTVKAEGPGTCNITVTAGNKSVLYKVTVTSAPQTVAITSTPSLPTSTPILKGQTYQLRAAVSPSTANQKVIWMSSDPTIATVTSTGKVTIKGRDDVTITATSAANPDIYAEFDFIGCRVPVTSLKVYGDSGKSSITVDPGNSYLIEVNAVPDDAYIAPTAKLTVTSSFPKNVEVDKNSVSLNTADGTGSFSLLVPATSTPGKYTVTVKLGTKSAKLTVTVKKPPATV